MTLFACLLACSDGERPAGEGTVLDDTGDAGDSGPVDSGDDTSTDDTSTDDTGDPPVDPILADGWVSTLTVTAGCDDALLFARNDADTIGVIFEAHNVAATAHAIGSAYSQSYSLPSSSASLTVYVGERVTGNYCVPEGSSGTRVVDFIFEPVAGSARITVTPSGEATESGDYPSDASLALTDVALVENDDPEQVGTIGLLEIWTAIGVQP